MDDEGPREFTAEQEQHIEALLRGARSGAPDAREGFLRAIAGGDGEVLAEAMTRLARLEPDAPDAAEDVAHLEPHVRHVVWAARKLSRLTQGAFLASACRDEPRIRAKAELLLDGETPRRVAPPEPNEAGDEIATDELPLLGNSPVPRHIGKYTIKRALATGGMGAVYVGLQHHPHRVVAIKVMKPGISSLAAMRRFQFESQILARFQHPNVAQVYDAGKHVMEDGVVPYFVMEYIPNARDVVRYAREAGLSVRERVELLAQVCDAVHHGHQKGIIHRDLKPDNILVDSSGRPKIIDFGVARATDSDLAVTSLQTNVGELIGTLQYMSPEQCDADPHDLDCRTDVYALGVVLFELVCGRLPYDVGKAAIHEAAAMIRETPPAAPSHLDPQVAGDLEVIILQALRKERAHRYQTAADLARDLKHFLAREPIEARPPSMQRRLHAIARDHEEDLRVLARTGVLVTLLIVAFLVGRCSTASDGERPSAAVTPTLPETAPPETAPPNPASPAPLPDSPSEAPD